MTNGNLINRILLYFYDKNSEKEFIRDYASKSVRTVQVGLIFGTIAFIVVGLIMDAKLFPDDPFILLHWRIVGSVITFVTAILLNNSRIQRYFQPLMIVVLTFIGFIIINTSMTYNKAGIFGASISVTSYIIFIHAISRVRFINAFILTWLIIIVYLIMFSTVSPPEGLLLRIAVFFVVANLFGMSASYGIESNVRDSFIKSKQLEASQKLLAEELKKSSYELEAVKELQLAMLPSKNPSCDIVDVAFHMSTATEVGGDYCDYLKGFDDSLTFAIGDATGHGAKASTMVMAVKMLFLENAARKTLSGFLRHASSAISNMKLPNIYMALALGRVSGNKLELVGAGLPSALIYRAETKKLEYFPLKGIPLGTFASNGYQEKEVLFNKDDVAVFMTDGVTELFNSNEEMYGTKLIEEQLHKYSECTAQQIVNYLVADADKWKKSEPLRDDMTLLVLKKL